MSVLKTIWDETFGLFVDDGALALQVVMLVAVVAVAVKFVGLGALMGSVLLLIGLMAILAASLWRAAHR